MTCTLSFSVLVATTVNSCYRSLFLSRVYSSNLNLKLSCILCSSSSCWLCAYSSIAFSSLTVKVVSYFNINIGYVKREVKCVVNPTYHVFFDVANHQSMGYINSSKILVSISDLNICLIGIKRFMYVSYAIVSNTNICSSSILLSIEYSFSIIQILVLISAI